MVGPASLYVALIIMYAYGPALLAASLSLPGPHEELKAYLHYARIFTQPTISKAAPGVRAAAISMVTQRVYQHTTALESPSSERRIARTKLGLSVVSTHKRVKSDLETDCIGLSCPMVGQEIKHLQPVESVIRTGLECLVYSEISSEERLQYLNIRLELERILDDLQSVDRGKLWIASLRQLDSIEGRSELFDDCQVMTKEVVRLRERLQDFHRLLNLVL